MNFRDLGVAFYTLAKKHSENNSGNKNVHGNRERQDKYSYFPIEKVSEKPNMKHLI